jgi:opacity protein-like surface antigen
LALENEQHPSQWPILGKVNADGAGFGGFAGYNTQWQDLVVGVEANYTRSSFSTTASVAPIGREVAAGGNTYDVNVSGTGTLDLIDYTSLRARAGAIYGNFLPYGFVGFVLGRANYSLTTLVSGQQNPSTPPVVPCDTTKSPSCVDFSFSNSAGQSSAFMYGVSLGGGLDFAVTQNIFLRGEFEYIRFAPISDIVVSIASARVGAGVKF